MKRFSVLSSALLALVVAEGPARADAGAPSPPAGEVASTSAKPEAPKPAPYSLPWQLRPIIAPTVLRAESSLAGYEDAAGRGGLTAASILTASYRIPGTGPASAGLAPVVRLAFVADDPPRGGTARAGATIVNPLVGAAYAFKLGGGFRLNAFFGVTLPVGGGGGDSPSKRSSNARVKGVNARAQMDNALFAVNDCTLIPGFGAAYVNGGLTVQAEVTLLELLRVRGDAVQREAVKTNLTSGLHVGYFVLPQLSIGAELRYQRWLNAPFSVDKDKTDATRDTLSMAIGPRVHIKVADVGWLRPGIAYQRGLDKPLAAATPNYHIVQFDVPFTF